MDNPIFYRWWVNCNKTPPFRSLLRFLLYPALISMACLANRNSDQMVLAIFLHFLYFCGCSIFGTARALSEEKRRKTYDCLLTSGLSPRQWLGSIFAVVCGPRALELLFFSPMWLSLFSSGRPTGSSAHQPSGSEVALWTSALILLSFCCMAAYASIGLWFSTRSRSGAVSQLWSTILLVVTFLMVIPIDMILLSPLTHHHDPILSAVVSPWIGYLMAFENNSGQVPFAPYLLGLLHIGAGVGFFGLALSNLTKPQSAQSPRPASSSPHFGGIENPLTYRLLLGLRQRKSQFISLFIPAAIVLAFRAYCQITGQSGRNFMDLEASLYFALATVLLYLTAQAVSSVNTAFAEERENGTFEILMGTRQSAAKLFWTKLATLLVWPVVQCILCAFLWQIFLERPLTHGSDYCDGWRLGPTTYMINSILWSWMLLCHAVAIWNASSTLSSSQALTRTALVLTLIVIGIPMVAYGIHLESLASFSPLFSIMNLAESHNLRVLGVAGLYSLLSVGLVITAARRFPKECLRLASARF